MSRLKSMRKLLTYCLGLWLFLSANMVAAKTRVTTLVVPFSAGSAQDMFARLISEPLARELGASVMVVNKPGAGGTIASAFVGNAKPDGQTYLLAANNHHLAGTMYPGLKYHPLNDFRGAAFFGFSDFALITSSSLKTHDLASFVAHVRAQPNAYNYASAGNGSTTHVGMASFLQTTQLQMTHIPLKGTGEIINEVLAGRVQAAMVSLMSVSGHRADPRIQILASTPPTSFSAFPQHPDRHGVGLPPISVEQLGGPAGAGGHAQRENSRHEPGCGQSLA
jgi:tripartite-type tricarboxylate transporter receptor subunit TctC